LTRISRKARAFLAIGVLLLAVPLQTLSATAEEYRLGTMDKLRVRVAEWQSAEGGFRDWSAVSGDYSVGPAGTISIPFVGELPVTGKTTAQVAAAIGDGLQQKLGLPDRPEASVELAEFRPIFVSGDVQTPGRYPYDPQLTVLKALSIAGGLRRSENGQGGARDFIMAQGNYEVMATQRDGLLARRARLDAEAADKQQIDFPPELGKTAAGKKLMADETNLMQARQKRLRLQLESLDNLKALLQAEIESLQKKIATQSRQTDLAREELKASTTLPARGLWSTSACSPSSRRSPNWRASCSTWIRPSCAPSSTSPRRHRTLSACRTIVTPRSPRIASRRKPISMR
jgi:exopolysaccharide production protein ExoF